MTAAASRARAWQDGARIRGPRISVVVGRADVGSSFILSRAEWEGRAALADRADRASSSRCWPPRSMTGTVAPTATASTPSG